MAPEDVEKDGAHSAVSPAPLDSPIKPQIIYDPSKESLATRLGVNLESFKRAPGATAGHVIEGETVNPLKAKENPMLQQKLKPRHLQMIAVGGSIGTGLFVGSGQGDTTLGEMCILYPASTGGFFGLSVRFLDPSFGMAMGWLYWMQWAATLPLEITAAAITVTYWPGAANVPQDLDTGRKAWFTAAEMNAWRAERRQAPWYLRVFRMLFSS